MPTLEKILGSYGHQQVIQPMGFQLNGAGAPTVFRDGTNVSTASGKMIGVVRTSIGLYAVQLDSKTPWPQLPFIVPMIEQASPATTPCQARYVLGSYSPSARTFQICIETVGTTPALSDADAGNRVTIVLMGGLAGPGVDPA